MHSYCDDSTLMHNVRMYRKFSKVYHNFAFLDLFCRNSISEPVVLDPYYFSKSHRGPKPEV